MEFAMREWLTVIIVLLIVGVLLDGWRRMRQSKKQSIKMSRSMQAGSESVGADKSSGETYGSELPNGGARVVAHRDEDNTKELTRSSQDTFEQTKTTPTQPPKIPEQVSLNLDEYVPMLMDPVQENSRIEPSLEAQELHESVALVTAVTEPESVVVSEPSAAASAAKSTDKAKSQAEKNNPESSDQQEEVLVINVMSVGDDRFQGGALLDVILACGMRFGDMKIFHRHFDEGGEGPLQFSMVNMVVPGTFDLNAMDEFETPGVSLFMTLPITGSSMEAFDCMSATAKAIADRLGGELKDENRSVMTAQTLEHCRARIREFERKQLV
mgnify:CR=1 FL=1